MGIGAGDRSLGRVGELSSLVSGGTGRRCGTGGEEEEEEEEEARGGVEWSTRVRIWLGLGIDLQHGACA
jgi:hypothetical protein